jgi:8-hydroxy-5-deazaflavin:NADPH oxidoreductase
MKSTIAIIGATGSIGSALARGLAQAGYPLLLMGRRKEKLSRLVDEVKALNKASVEALGCAKEAAWEADMIIPAVPYPAQEEIVSHIRPVAVGKIVVSIANPFDSKVESLLTTTGTSAAEELQFLLPHSKVVKVFSTAFVSYAFCQCIPAACLLAGDDLPAADAVQQLAKDAGFNPLIVGNLSESRTLESMMLMFARLSREYRYNLYAPWKSESINPKSITIN